MNEEVFLMVPLKVHRVFKKKREVINIIKKRGFLFIIAIFTCLTNVHSQLQVDSTGHVGIGVTDEILEDEEADSIMSPLSVGTAGYADRFASFLSAGKHYTLFVDNRNTGSADGVGIQSFSNTTSGNSQGIVGVGLSDFSSSNSTIGVRGTTLGSYNSVGVYGGSYVFNLAYENFAGVFGSTSSGLPYFQYPGVYAGYFDGTVRATGPMYAQAFYTPSADPNEGNRAGTTSVCLIGEEESITDKFRNISMFELQHNEQQGQERLQNPSEEFLGGRSIQDLSRKELHQLDSINSSIIPVKNDPLSSVNYGLDASQLKVAFPKLVQQDEEGNYSINYVEMIPLLVKGLNEMSAKIEILEHKLAEKTHSRNVKSETTSIADVPNEIDMVRMDQNKPNPFSESTVIGLNIPEKTQKANIFIYDLSGKQIQNVMVTERGETNITVYAKDLNAGMYIYSLVADGRVVVTRRMMVDK